MKSVTLAFVMVNVATMLLVSVQQSYGTVHNFPTSVSGMFKLDNDSKWRCYTNTTIINDYTQDVTIGWIFANATNVTYVDDTFEELGITGNETVNQVIPSGAQHTWQWTLTAIGFDKEPKNLSLEFKASVLGFENQISSASVIPEFASLTMVTVFMMVTLLAVIIVRKGLERKVTEINNRTKCARATK
jgi:hypothetical protein